MKKPDKSLYLYSAALQDHIARAYITLPKLNNKLSLAQKLGLVPSPPKPVTVDEWLTIEEHAKKRNDVSECICPICLEKFKAQAHVILNCSHIYHKVCLESFEKVSKVKQCPICRKQDYEKKLYHNANKEYRLKSIVRIQAMCRGYRSRIKFYERMIAEGYRPQSTLLRRKLLFYKLSRVSGRMQKQMKKQQVQANQAVQGLKQNYLVQQQEMDDNMVRIRQLKNINQEERKYIPKQPSEIIDWKKIRQVCLDRKETDCTICFQSMIKCKVYLLSCSHMFHANCTNAFERYHLDDVHTCPLCRQAYQKQHFQLQ